MVDDNQDNIRKNRNPFQSDNLATNSSIKLLNDLRMDSFVERSSKISQMDTDYDTNNLNNPQINMMSMQLKLMNMMHMMDEKLQHIENHVEEINSNFDDFSMGISSRIESYNNNIFSRFDSLELQFRNSENSLSNNHHRPERRVSFSCLTKFNNEKQNQTSSSKDRKEVNPPNVPKRIKSKHKYKSISYSSASSQEYDIKRVQKSNEDKLVISHVVKNSSYYKFSSCCDDELTDIIDAFDVENFASGSLIVNQGDTFSRFYIVKSGFVDLLSDGLYLSSLTPKQAFETSFMMGAESVSTFRAKCDCEIWSLSVETFRSISIHYKRMRSSFKTNFLKSVKIGGKILGEFLDDSEIDAIALATKIEYFDEGSEIIKEGDKGDKFYMIEEGDVNIYIGKLGPDPIRTLNKGAFFGEKALMSDDIRTATCTAASRVKCLVLVRDDFVRMLGNLKEILDTYKEKQKTPQPRSNVPRRASMKRIKSDLKLSDLIIEENISSTSFGTIKQVSLSENYASRSSSKTKTFALKCSSKQLLAESEFLHCVENEMELLSELESPFIVRFFTHFEDYNYMYFLLENMNGQDLSNIMNDFLNIPEECCRFYTASIVLALEEIHSMKAAYRGLAPENIMIGSNGYLKLMNFEFAKKLHRGKTFSLCGVSDYLAPEVITNEGHDWGVDCWALGVLIYEMISGLPPFWADTEVETYTKIVSGNIDFTTMFNPELNDLIKSLCAIDQSKRLGRIKGGWDIVKDHLWFSGFSWDLLRSKEMEATYLPNQQEANKYAGLSSTEIVNIKIKDDKSVESEITRDDSQSLPNKLVDENSDAGYNSDSEFFRLSYSNVSDIASDRPELCEKVRNRRKTTTQDSNRFSISMEKLRSFQSNNLNHMIVKSPSTKKSSDKSFNQFFLLSALPEEIFSLKGERMSTGNLSCSSFCQPAELIDRYPLTLPDSSFSVDEIASVCFPSGVQIRFIPRCAKEMALKKGLMGIEADKYQLHTFRDETGETQYGVSVTIREELSAIQTQRFLNFRKEYKAAVIITNFFIRSHERRRSSISSNLMGAFGRMTKGVSLKNMQRGSRFGTKMIALSRANESYEAMLKNAELGEICVAEKCFVFTGTTEQSLMLCALQQIIQLERMAFSPQSKRMFHSFIEQDILNEKDAIKGSRHCMLLKIENKLSLSPRQAQIAYPVDETQHINRKLTKFEAQPLLDDFPKISLPLPLPGMTGEWGVATLFLRFHGRSLLLILNLLLLENSVLMVGTKHEEVSCCTLALLDLLAPFEWASAFINSIPIDYLEFINSPVPFIGGLVPENKKSLRRILKGKLVKDAIANGLIVLNLDSGEVFVGENEKQNALAFSQTIAQRKQIKCYQNKLKYLSAEKTSSLKSFDQFFQKGATVQESLVIKSLRRDIRDNFKDQFRFLDFENSDEWKKYCKLNQETKFHDFYPGRLISYFKCNVKFLSLMSNTQLFMEYFEKLKDPLLTFESNNRAALFIADWLSFRWKRHSGKKNICCNMRCNQRGIHTCQECEHTVAL